LADGNFSYFDDPCPYCGGPHSWQIFLNSPGGGLCAQSLTHEWSICDKCGNQNGHWDNCAYLSFPSPNPRYGDSTFCDNNYRDMEVEKIEHGQNGEFKLRLECLLEGGNKEQNVLEELLENSLQNDLALERLNSQMGEMLEALEVQKASEVNDSQEHSLEVEAENPSLELDQNQEELSNAQNERMMLMLEAILENKEKQNLALEDLNKHYIEMMRLSALWKIK